MFTALHDLAQSATLMIVVAAEDDQLRVSITPTTTGDKTKPHALRPLSLLATPAELDADFAAALAIWQAPKRSLIEQAHAAAAGGADDDAGESSDGAPSTSAQAPKKAKPGRKKNADAAANPALAQGDAGAGAPAGEPEATTEPEQPTEIAPPPPAQQPATDEFTLDLF